MGFDFQSSNPDFIDIGSSAISTTLPVSMACWFQADDIDTEYSLMDIGDESVTNQALELVLRGGNLGDPVSANHRSGSSAISSSSTGFSVNAWHHGCAVFTSTTLRASFIDGGSKGTDSNAKSVPSGLDTTRLGTRARNGGGASLDGKIAEAAFWNVALTDDEVAVLGAGFSPLFVRPGNLLLYAPMVQNPLVASYGGQVMTVTGSPSVTSHPPVVYPWSPVMGGVPVVAGGTSNMPLLLQMMDHFRAGIAA